MKWSAKSPDDDRVAHLRSKAKRGGCPSSSRQVVELQQQLKSTQHQLRMEEARSGESSRLERDTRDLTDSLASLRARHHEDHITRSLVHTRYNVFNAHTLQGL